MGKTSKITGEKIGVEKMKTKQQIELKLAYNQLKESNERIRFILEATNTGTWEWNVQTGETVFNEIWAQMIGYTLEELGPTTIETWSNLCHPGDLEIAKVQLNKYFNKETDQYETEFRLKHKNGHWVWVFDRGKVSVWTNDGKPLWMLGTHQNITERKLAEEAIKLDEARMESLLKINQYPAENIQKLLDFALEEAISLTGSKIGYIYFYNEEKKEFTLNTWSREVMQQCNVVEPQTIYELDKTGIWGEAVRQRKPIVVNDFTVSDPLKKGTPQGHAPLHKFLTIPVFSEKHIVAVIGVANKPDNYNDSDIRQLNLMMDAVWKIVQRKQTEEALKESETKYRTLFTQMNEGFALHKVIYDTAHHAVDYKILDINPVFEKQVGISAEKANGALATELYGVSSAPYLDIYAQVAETGEHRFFQTYFPPLDRSFEISVFSPKQGFFATVFSDITERKQAEEALKKSEEMWRSLVKTIPDFIALYDNKGQYLFLNHFAEGFSLKDIEGKHYTDFLADDSKIIYERAFEEAEQTRTTQYIEYSAYGDNRTLKNYESNIVPIFEGENLVNMLVIARDITQRELSRQTLADRDARFRMELEMELAERRKSQMKLETSNILLTAILESSPNVIVFALDRNYRYLTFNKKHKEIMQLIWGKEIKIGKDMLEIIGDHPDREKARINFNRAFAGESFDLIEEYGDEALTRQYWQNFYSPIRSVNGEIVGITCYVLDISEQKQAEEALKQSELKYRTIVNSTSEAIFIFDPQTGSIIDCNQAASNMYGLTKEEFLRAKISDIGASNEDYIRGKILERIKAALKSEDITYEWKGKRKNNEIFWSEVSLNESVIGGEKRIIAVIRDVEERKKMETEILQREAEMNKLNAAKDKFFSIISHDLRSPFASIIGLAELMADNFADLSADKFHEYARSINKTAQSTYRLLENLLEWSRLQQGVIPFNPQPTNLKEEFGTFDDSMVEIARKKSITLEVDIPEGLQVTADRNMLHSILRNLVTNAIKFTRQNGSVNVCARSKDGNIVLFTIKDTGIGMDSERINKLFRIDTNVSRPGTEGEASSGLGLILCKEFVEKQGGTIWVESGEGMGSIFYFTIPQG